MPNQTHNNLYSAIQKGKMCKFCQIVAMEGTKENILISAK